MLPEPGRSSPDRRGGGSCLQMHTRRGGITQWGEGACKRRRRSPRARALLLFLVRGGVLELVSGGGASASEGIYWKLRRCIYGAALGRNCPLLWCSMERRQNVVADTTRPRKGSLFFLSWHHGSRWCLFIAWHFAKSKARAIG